MLRTYLVTMLTFLLLATVLTGPGYLSMLPHASALYPASKYEAQFALQTNDGYLNDKFRITDETLAPGFAEILSDPPSEINYVGSKVVPSVTLLKFLINRPRPHQVSQRVLNSMEESKSAHTPSFPSGHSAQAFAIAKHYSRLYPAKRDELYRIAEAIGRARISAGLHYPSDHIMSKELVRHFF